MGGERSIEMIVQVMVSGSKQVLDQQVRHTVRTVDAQIQTGKIRNEFPQERQVRRLDILIDDLSPLVHGHRDDRLGFDHTLQFPQAAVLSDRNRLGPADLQSVVLRRIVASGDLDRRIGLVMHRSEIHHRGCGETKVPDVTSCVVDAFAQIFENFVAGGSYVPPYDHMVAFQQARKKESDLVYGILVEVLIVDPSDVIRFECSHEIPPLAEP